MWNASDRGVQENDIQAGEQEARIHLLFAGIQNVTAVRLLTRKTELTISFLHY